MAQACGAVVRYTRDSNRSSVDTRVVEVADALKAGGRKPFAMPRGGATGLGTVGMVLGVQELAAQLDEAGIEPDMVVIATGSGGAGAGLALGASLCERPWRVVGASVSRPANEIATQVQMLAADCAELLGVAPPADGGLELADARGPGHGLPSADGESASRVALRTEGLVLDPVYTAKALAVLFRLLDPASKRPVVFWHTGGLLGAAHHLAGRPRGVTEGGGGPGAGSWWSPASPWRTPTRPLLHEGLNLADIAHVIDLRGRRVVPEDAARQLLDLLVEVHGMPAEDFPYDPSFGEAYNSRERYFVSRLGDVAGWLHAGRPRREATRLALRLLLRRQLVGPGRRRGRLRRQRGGPGRGPRRHPHARPDLPPAGPAVDVRPLRPVLRLPDRARRRPACSSASSG